MKFPQYTNIAVFILFFGLALVEAFMRGSWISAGLFFALGEVSLWADFKKS